MRLTTKGRYAVNAVLDLYLIYTRDKQYKDNPVSLNLIAENQNISLSYLEQLFTKLRKAGVVKGVRGPGGGYLLARVASEITIAEIVAAVDEVIDATQCGGVRNCQAGRVCSTHSLWQKLSEKLYDFLNDITIEELSSWPSVQQSLDLPLNNLQAGTDATMTSSSSVKVALNAV